MTRLRGILTAAAMSLLLAISSAATPVTATEAARAQQFPPIWVWPSGCISIAAYQRNVDPYPWWWENYAGITYWDNVNHFYRRQMVYRLRMAPYPNEFIGAQDWPNDSFVWLAPVGAPNQVNRSINCMLSNGGTQG